MTAGVFDGVWPYGQTLRAFDADSVNGREFTGFLEPLSLTDCDAEERTEAGIVCKEKYRLIASPSETFPYGPATLIVCGSIKYELLSIKEVQAGEKISHRECVLLKVGKAAGNA